MLADLAQLGDCSAWRRVVPDLGALDSSSLIDVIADCARLESAFLERWLAATAQFLTVVDRELEVRGEWSSDPSELAEAQISEATTAKRSHAGAELSLALSLRDRLPRTRVALATGHLSAFRVRQIESATANVEADRVAEVEAEALRSIAPDAPETEPNWERGGRPPARRPPHGDEPRRLQGRRPHVGPAPCRRPHGVGRRGPGPRVHLR
ncbi:DUF222 domain-containing protein [Tomitella gaofuii]|uniref:DUF222 domain-containing protein n=1 Tax=Tomitella gaofuii TaxID=2760083 RepID=UPI0022A8C8F9|nr:DUF222 domain-containing protein [Tomitella gaofuii]